MPMAFLLINSELGAEQGLANELRSIKNVKEVYPVYGVYDIVAKVQADTVENIKDTINWKVRRLQRVNSTTTMVVID